MDSESLDRCIQTALSALYPPFQATSPTVLCQVLSVVESCYRGDGLRYLIHFLLPAKQLLTDLQQNACLQYCGLLFRHEGWPLCVHEKVVVQLCPLDQRLLRPGDFYLLVSPPPPPPPQAHSASCRRAVTSSSPRLLLCSVSAGGRHVEQQEVSEIAPRSLFSMAWLDSVNREKEQRGAPRLERCLLSAHGDVFRVPWEDLVYPQFISRPQTSLQEETESSVKDGDALINPSSSRQEVELLQSAASGEDSEGEYVELMELPRFSPQKGSLTQSISLQHRARTSTHTTAHTLSEAAHTPHNTHTLSAAAHTLSAAAHTHSAAAHTLHNTHTLSAAAHTPHNTHTLSDAAHTPHNTHTLSAAAHTPHNTHTLSDAAHTPHNTHTLSAAAHTLHNTHTLSAAAHTHSDAAHTPHNTHTLSAAAHTLHNTHTLSAAAHTLHNTHTLSAAAHTPHTLSSWPCVEVSSHTTLCSRLIEENLIQDSCGPVILTPISLTSSSSSAPPEAVGTSSWTSQEHIEGTDSGISLKSNTEPESSAEHSEEEEEEEEEERGKEGETEETREERELMKRRKGMHEMVVSDDEDEEKDEEQLEDAECRKDEGLLNESEEKEEELDEEGDEELEVEVEEEVQVTVQHQSQERREEEQVMKEDVRGEEETHPKDSYSENNRENTHSEDSYSEKNTQHKHYEDSYCENISQQKLSVDSYSESNRQLTHSEDSYSENKTLQTHSGDSYSENDRLQTLSEDSYSESNRQLTHSEDSYSENETLQTHSEDSYSENNTPAMDPDSLWCELEESEKGREKQEKKEEEEEDEEEISCEEVGGGRTAELQTEGLSRPPVQSHVPLSTGPSPTEPEPQLDQSAAPTVPVRLTQSSQSSFYTVLLRSGALCLPGTRDRSGRALLTICTRSSVWSNPDCDGAELLHLLLYYSSTLRKEVAALGLTVLVDARRAAAPVPALFSALRSLQENVPGSVCSVLLLLDKDSSLRLDKPAATQVEVLFSLKSLHKQVDLQQLPEEFGGSFSFSQRSWLCFRSRVEQLTNQCEDVIKLLQKTINILQNTPLPAAEEAELLLSRYQAVMRSILEDSRLVQLQQEGGASLSLLRREDGVTVTLDQRAAVETVSSLYEQVDELLHRLVTLSNSRTQELNFILDFRGLETGFSEVSSWLQDVGEVRLKSLNEAEDSLELLNKKLLNYKEFHSTAYERCRRGEELLSRLDRWGHMTSADLHVYEVKVHCFWAQLQDFSQRINTTGQNLERAVRLYSFLDQAYGWALEGMRHLAGVSMEDCTLPDKCQSVIGCLEEYRRQHPLIPDDRFQEMKAAAGELRGERGLRQWSFAWSKCQETKKMFDRKMEAALRTRDSAHRRHADSAHRQRSDSALSRCSASSRRTLSGLWGLHGTSSSSSSTCPPEEDNNSSSLPCNSSSLLPSSTSSPLLTSSPVTPQHTPLLQRLFHGVSSQESADQVDICSSSPSLSSSFFSSGRRQQLRKTQSFDCPPSTPEVSRLGGSCPRALSEPVRRGNTGVFIRGLEVSSSEAADRTLCPRTAARGWAGQGLRSPGTPRTTVSPATETRPRGSKLRHVVEEMVTTEREYVRSLRYIIHHYFPEMDRADLPQDLRGKRSVVFGNLEKLLDFHSQFFLRELEACWRHPLRVPHCFIRHKDQFSLYALYSKNKPKSDALLANHGNSFFRRKQVELGDKMDLSSYLLKPVQRMSKYALLLTDLIKEVGGAQEAELDALQAATNMVKFQLRHGNDLLAMDAIRDCDVNLKEQGQLIRQDEFTVWTGRRKCQRHIFLFEELVLFSKPKKMEGGLDVFIYKHSFKTADVGLTESAGDNGLRFEIWFRRRTSKNQTFILQAATSEVKHAWTTGVARILWTQATRNKEIRLKEMVSMGVGNKPFLDIQPSDAAISDRAVHYIMKSRGARTRASIAVSVFDHSNPFNGGAVSSDPSASGPSSSSLLGPLNLHMYSQNRSSSPAAEGSFITSCIEEDEQETSSQPSMTTESSGSSSRCLSGSSDSGCVSSLLQEVLPEEPSSYSSSSSNRRHLSSQFISPTAVPVISPSTIM
ncbi:pleckstrin homology domain-containing family G member 4B isoform X2 [Cebidichthys violaceus]|uniref:pleckstrin homology domain-containing family G member 4B isoform X2 n=1 Tax=Cebidichthys violaceus TaxID=271503 RepID=UPI0035CB7132